MKVLFLRVCLSLLCLWYGSGYTCGEEVSPILEPQEAFLEVAQCKDVLEPSDYQEHVLTLVEQFSRDKPVRRKAIERTEWYDTYLQAFAPGVQRGGGTDDFEPAVAIYAAQGRQDGELDAGDARVLRALLPSKPPPTCSSTHVSCQLRGDRLRVVALQYAPKSNAKWPKLLPRLSELQALTWSFRSGSFASVEEAFAGIHWPRLEALELFFADEDAPMRQLAEHLFTRLVARHANLRSVTIMPGKYHEFDFNLSAYCDLAELRQLLLPDMNIHAIPPCFGRLRKLRSLYFPCNYLQEAPSALANLPELRAFTAFRQGEYTPCHLKPPRPQNLIELEDLKQRFGDCKLIFETSIGQDGEDSPRILCPWVSIRGTLQDWLDLKWAKLEKLWLDGNFIQGPMPASIPQVWPNLRSLDLYSNELTGSIPASLGQLHFDKLQLQQNHLSGRVPLEIFAIGCCYFNIAANPNLTGCFPSGSLDGERVRKHYKQGIPGTQVGICGGGEL